MVFIFLRLDDVPILSAVVVVHTFQNPASPWIMKK